MRLELALAAQAVSQVSTCNFGGSDGRNLARTIVRSQKAIGRDRSETRSDANVWPCNRWGAATLGRYAAVPQIAVPYTTPDVALPTPTRDLETEHSRPS
jgi:hypothetical protein